TVLVESLEILTEVFFWVEEEHPHNAAQQSALRKERNGFIQPYKAYLPVPFLKWIGLPFSFFSDS
ncbi:MAG: hypothetical protein K2H85_03870, partial [Allobaculum sp.]|nr:hypothetical protein [Allobaculum sp.]